LINIYGDKEETEIFDSIIDKIRSPKIILKFAAMAEKIKARAFFAAR
jgi:hypothetical protein